MVPQLLCLIIILTCFPFIFTYNIPLHTPSAPSPTDSIRGGEPMYLVIPFQIPGQPQRLQRLLEKLLFYYLQLYKELNKAVDECHLVVDLRALLREKKIKIIKQLYFYVLIDFL